MLKLNFKVLLKLFKVIIVVNLTIFPSKQFFLTNSMIFRFSCPHKSSQNEKDERMIRTLNNISCTMLLHASLPLTFWDYALETATYLCNILPTKTLQRSLLSRLYFTTPRPMFTFACWGVYVIPISHLLPLIHLLHNLLLAFSQAILKIIEAIVVLTYPQINTSSLAFHPC